MSNGYTETAQRVIDAVLDKLEEEYPDILAFLSEYYPNYRAQFDEQDCNSVLCGDAYYGLEEEIANILIAFDMKYAPADIKGKEEKK